MEKVKMNKNLFHYFTKFILWYMKRAQEKYEKKSCKICKICKSTADFVAKQRFFSDNEKALFYDLAGNFTKNFAKNCKCYDAAIRLYEHCIDFAGKLPEIKSLAFEKINWIRQELARLEATEGMGRKE